MLDADYGEWLARGQAHQQAGRPIDAMVCYRRALKANRHAVQAHFHLGEVLHALGSDDEARAAWRQAITWQPRHVPSLFFLADAARRAGAAADAAEAYRRVLAIEPHHASARSGLVLALLAQGDEAALPELTRQLASGATFDRFDELARLLAAAPSSPNRHALLATIDSLRPAEIPPLLLALLAEDAQSVTSGTDSRAWALERAAELAPTIDDPEALRRLALVAATLQPQCRWPERYAVRCMVAFSPTAPVLWPRRTAGDRLRIAYLVTPGRPLEIGGVAIDAVRYVECVIAAHPRERFAPVIFIVEAAAAAGAPLVTAGLPISRLGPAPDPALARPIAEGDYDALIDLAGMAAATGALLAQRPARSVWTYRDLVGAHIAPLITNTLPPLDVASDDALEKHRIAIESSLLDFCTNAPWFIGRASLSADAIAKAWRAAVAAHQAGDADAAIDGYRRVLDQQPDHAQAHYLLGLLLRDRGEARAAERELTAAIASAPAYADARCALANVQRAGGRADTAVETCRTGLKPMAGVASLWRALGLAELARQEGESAREAFEQALALAPTDAQTHYNHGVALQMLHRREEALRAYQRALAFDPEQIAADFNIGVILQEQDRADAAIHAFERVLARDPGYVPAHKALGEVLLAARRINDWLRAFDRFEARCPRSLAVAVRALEVNAYRGDFAAIDRYLERLRGDDFVPESRTDLADCLEQLLFLLLYFDVEPETHFAMYRAYDAVAPQVYGTPLPSPAVRRKGRLRIGYLSGDLRNHVMGKMMWEAIRHHDRNRFEIRFYSTVADSDEWTERFREFGDGYLTLANDTDPQAALRIATDDLDILVDLSTHTKGARPGILALKPARVQITHIASAGAVGMSTIDFKLTDALADLPDNQAFYLETLLPMAGCVYPYRHIEPAAVHPFHRDRLGIPPDAFVLGAFVNPLKLSRRCLALWREVLERIPRAMLAISPPSPEARSVYARLLPFGGIPLERVIILPQGRDDAENQARYNLIDFAVDPVPYSGVNGTLEALGMSVPVVTLCGRTHGERTSYSILTNLGVTQTIAHSGSEYVAIAERLANDAAFAVEVRAAIRAGISSSPLTDMRAHTRNLERAYVEALQRRRPEVLNGIAR